MRFHTADLEDEFSEFLSIAVYTLAKPEVMAEMSGPAGTPSDKLVSMFFEATNGLERKHALLALVMLVHEFVEDWHKDEQLLKRPVQ